MRLSAFGLRVASMVVVLPAVLGLLYLGGLWLLCGLVGVYLLGAHEWSRICDEGGSIPVSWLNFIGGLPILWIGYSHRFALLGPVLAALIAVNLVLPPLIGLSGGTIGMDLFGQMYLSLPLAYLELLRARGFEPAAAAMLLVWCGDIGGYLVGSVFGRHKLLPRLSPGKSWEGVGGAVAFAAVAGYLLLGLMLGQPPWRSVFEGALAGAFGVLGDLGESAVKRWANAKDSGVFMPGHGGILDRLDSLLFALPALYYLLR